RPGGPWSSTWSSASPRLFAAWTNTRRFSRAACWPMNSSRLLGRSAASASSDVRSGVVIRAGSVAIGAANVAKVESSTRARARQRVPHGLPNTRNCPQSRHGGDDAQSGPCRTELSIVLDPVVLAILPNREGGREEERVVECAERDGDEVVELVVELSVDLVINVRPA